MYMYACTFWVNEGDTGEMVKDGHCWKDAVGLDRVGLCVRHSVANWKGLNLIDRPNGAITFSDRRSNRVASDRAVRGRLRQYDV